MRVRSSLEIRSRPVRGRPLDCGLLEEFESLLLPHDPERSRIPCRILGYGEITTVFEIREKAFEGLAIKRMSVFESAEELVRYVDAYDAYNRLLEEDVGLRLPDHGYAAVRGRGGRPLFYIAQRKFPPEAFGNKAIHRLSTDGARALFGRVLAELAKLLAFNRAQTRYDVALDGQISNWAVADEGDGPVELYYIDTSTPLFRIDGIEQLEPELFLRAAPPFLVPVVRALFLDEVMNRYYQPRRMLLDLLANLLKEGRPELVPVLAPMANDFLASTPEAGEARPLDLPEIRSYYRQDARMWALFLSLRRLDRFMRRRVLRRDYPYILPGPIRRRQ